MSLNINVFLFAFIILVSMFVGFCICILYGKSTIVYSCIEENSKLEKIIDGTLTIKGEINNGKYN